MNKKTKFKHGIDLEFSKTKCQINQFQPTSSSGILSKQRSIQISNTDLFSRTTVSRLVEHLFRFILENCPSKNGRNLVQIIIQAKINSYKDMEFSAPRKHFCETEPVSRSFPASVRPLCSRMYEELYLKFISPLTAV